MIKLRAVAAAAADELADFGVVRVRGASMPTLMVPSDCGDSVLIEFQHGRGTYPDHREFFVTMSSHLLPYTAWLRRQTLDEARQKPPEVHECVFDNRLQWPRGWKGDVWELDPATQEQVLAELATELRRALTEVWLPVLPRPALRALLREMVPDTKNFRRPLASRGDLLVLGLMCDIEELGAADLSGLTKYLRGRGEADDWYPQLADWIERVFLSRFH